ncbi:hypothetical protein, partial [Enterovibrio norvegicus]|uniref:hypothetical protein n=1 Tax=Enterovibrio norvegicus TaxID=188144 RepID=UPI001A7E051E
MEQKSRKSSFEGREGAGRAERAERAEGAESEKGLAFLRRDKFKNVLASQMKRTRIFLHFLH